jgi:hypothetical protein
MPRFYRIYRALRSATLHSLAVALLVTPGVALTGGLCLAQASAVPAADPSPESAGAASPGLNSPPAEPAPSQLDTARTAVQRALDAARGQSVTLGLGYSQKTITFNQFKGFANSSAQITDNGMIVPYVAYNSPESYFWELPMQVGRVAVGYNFVATYESFSVNRQLTNGPFQGANVGTKVTGSYVAAAPMVFARLGPLYPDRQIFWKLGIGVGAAATQYSGDVIATRNDGLEELQNVKANSGTIGLYNTEVLELQVEHWSLLFKAESILANGAHETANLQEYSLTLAYAVRF